jgi:2-amino-4-hydroxy-6-hydroxymethyldihydropteridine diphosphokinase
MIACYIGIGANLGDAARTVRQAIDSLDELASCILIEASPLYASAPLDAGGPDYVNAVVALETKLSAHNLLRQLQQLEQAFGRKRPFKHAPRTLDLDLLLYGDQVIEEPGLQVPHPRMMQRAFVLKPLLDIAPDVIVPGHGLAAAFLGGVAGQACRHL